MNSLEPEVEQAVDAICALGCNQVSACIRALQQRHIRGPNTSRSTRNSGPACCAS